jgi:hypothetical protein
VVERPADASSINTSETIQAPPSHLMPLLCGELRALNLIGRRTAIDLSTNDSAADDLAAAGSWDESRQLRGRFVEWLICESTLCAALPANRLAFIGVKMIGSFDLSFRKISTYLFFRRCSLPAGMRIQSSRFVGIEFIEVNLGAVNAWATTVEGPFRFERTHISGMLQFANAKIVGDLSLDQSVVDAYGALAFNAPNLAIQGNLSFSDSRIVGRLNLINASITGEFNMFGGQVIPGSGHAIAADGINITGRCFITNGAEIGGTIRLIGAKVGGELNLNSARIIQRADIALDGRTARVGGAANFNNGFYALGMVTLYGAEIGGELRFFGATIDRPRELALDLRAITVKSAINFTGGFSIKGRIGLYAANIHGDLTFAGATLVEARGDALDARRCKVDGSVFLNDGFAAHDCVTFVGASVKGGIFLLRSNIDTKGLSLDLSSAKAGSLALEDATINGGTSLIGAEFDGDISFNKSKLSSNLYRTVNADNVRARTFRLESNTTIVGPVSLRSARFSRDMIVGARLAKHDDSNNDVIFDAISMRCDGVLHWQPQVNHLSGTANFEHAHVGALNDQLDRWPTQIQLDGFTYDRLNRPQTFDERLEWLKRQDRYHSQPFEQLIAAYRKLGDASSAAEVAIGKWRMRRGEMPEWNPRRFWELPRVWDYFLDISSGYGYRPWRPFIGLLLVLATGTAVYAWGAQQGAFCPIDTMKNSPKPCEQLPQLPHFNPLAYSVETLLPLGELGQRRFYVLRDDVPASHYIGWYTLLHRLLGTVFSLLLALAPTNILRRE